MVSDEHPQQQPFMADEQHVNTDSLHIHHFLLSSQSLNNYDL